MPATKARRGTLRLALALAVLVPCPAARAASVQGSLAVSVEVVASCRVSSGPGKPSALVACGPTGVPTSGAAAAPAAGEARAAAAGPVPARILVEPTQDGGGWLTVVY